MRYEPNAAIPLPADLPETVRVSLPKYGKQPAHVAECQVTGRQLDWPRVVLPYGGTVEVARATLLRLAKNGGTLKV